LKQLPVSDKNFMIGANISCGAGGVNTMARGVARNLIWVGINGSRRQNNHIKKFKVD